MSPSSWYLSAPKLLMLYDSLVPKMLPMQLLNPIPAWYDLNALNYHALTNPPFPFYAYEYPVQV